MASGVDWREAFVPQLKRFFKGGKLIPTHSFLWYKYVHIHTSSFISNLALIQLYVGKPSSTYVYLIHTIVVFQNSIRNVLVCITISKTSHFVNDSIRPSFNGSNCMTDGISFSRLPCTCIRHSCHRDPIEKRKEAHEACKTTCVRI